MILKTLFHKARSGDTKAQKELFEITSAQLNSVAIRYVVDTNLAKDVLQETYIRIFNQINSFNYKSEASTLAWMKRITSTESLRILRKRKRWTELEKNSNNTTTSMPQAFENDEILKALFYLSPKERIVFNMHVLEGYSHKEIGQHLGLAESSSRSLLTRARIQLQSIIIKNATYEKVS